MLELLINTLKDFDGAEYLIKESKTRRIENYSIKQESEMYREVEVTQLLLTLYVTFSETDEKGEVIKYRGSYNTEIHPGTSDDELRDIIGQGLFAAGFVKNAWYPLVTASAPAGAPGETGAFDEMKALKELQAAFYACDCHTSGHISYSEFFLTVEDIRIINSSGVDVAYTANNAYVETAIHWRNESGGETETSEAFRFSLPADTSAACEMIKERVGRIFTIAAEKSVAQRTPQAEDINILLTGECLADFFNYYWACANAQMIYQQLSTFEAGEQVQGGADDVCDRLTLTLEPLMEGSSHSRPYDDDGMGVAPHKIINNGKLLKYWGNTRFSNYLGIPPTGTINNYHVTGGTASSEELRQAPYLELVSFSAFQVNPITGDFGSEIRLGFYFDGETTIPVTGGSITGNMANVHDSMRMSLEERQYNNYRGPATVSFRGASISGK